MINTMTRRLGRGTIYVVATDCGLLKIGMAVDSSRRLRCLQGGSPVRLTVLGVGRVESPLVDEAGLHRRFDRYRRHGEWFDDAHEIREWLRLDFRSDAHLTRLGQEAIEAVWNRGGSRNIAGDREALGNRADAFARLRGN